MLRILKNIFIGILMISLLLCITQIVVIFFMVGKLSYQNVPFEQNHPQARFNILVVGDSTAVGTGTKDNRESIAGRLGQDFPDAKIVNISRNGQRIHELASNFNLIPKSHYSLAVIQIGANDIMRLTPIKNVETDLSIMISRAQEISDHVVILHSGNVGLAPIFTWPFNWILTERARLVRHLYIEKARETGAVYVDLFQERKDDVFLKDIKVYYSADFLHPSGAGYGWWYKRLRETLEAQHIVL